MSMLDRMKDYKHRLLQRRNRTLSGQVHNLEELHEGSDQEHDPDNFELASEVIDACLVELNMLKSSQQTSSWYLDSGATHHVSGDPSVFKSIHPASGACICSEEDTIMK